MTSNLGDRLWPRRTVLGAMPAAMIAGLTAFRSTAQAAGAADGARSQAFAALEPYCGVYRLGPDHNVGIDRFVNDDGDGVLLFSDHKTGVTRRLFQASPDGLSVGPGFNTPSPVELAISVARDQGGSIKAIRVRSKDGSEASAPKAAAREEEVSFRQGDAMLAGTLILPEGPGPHPAIVLLHGSGPLTRYSFGPYRRFFNGLGLAVLAYDKRGTGLSSGRRLDASTGAPATLLPAFYPDDLRADALAALSFLQGRSEIDARRIGFWGSSEGGMLSTQAAAHGRDVAFAINSSGFMGPLWRTLLYQGAAQMRNAGRPQTEIGQAVAFNQFWMDVARTGQGYDAFVERRADILRSGRPEQLFYVSDEFTSLEQMRWAWSHILTFDPLPSLAKVRCPALGVFGQEDRLTDAGHASQAMREAIAAGGNADVTVKVFPSAGHSLMETPSGARMAPGVYDTLRSWLLARTAAA